MSNHLSQHRSFLAMLAVATVAHVLLLLLPVARQWAQPAVEPPTFSVRLTRPVAAEPPPEEQSASVPVEPPSIVPIAPVELAALPADGPPEAEAERDTAPQVSAHRILSDLQSRRKTDPLGSFADERLVDRPDYFVRTRPVLEDVLKQPSLQLPFRDNRIYLVDSYDAGFAGGVQRFFDEATVPFGFTTKNNTRIQCAWILVIAGCSWGDVAYYYAKDKVKKRQPENM